MLFTVAHAEHKRYVFFFMNENYRFYHVVVSAREDRVAALSCVLLWFSQKSEEELLHLGYFHFWTLTLLTLLALHIHTHTHRQRERERERERNQK